MAFTERSYPFKRKQEGGDGFWRRRCEIASSRKLCSRVPRTPTYLEPFRGWSCSASVLVVFFRSSLWIPGWFVFLLALLTVTIVIDHYYDLSRSPRTALRLFLGWLCRRSSADWQRLVYTLEKLRDFASASHSYLLLEIFHTGTNEGIILIMRHIEWLF